MVKRRRVGGKEGRFKVKEDQRYVGKKRSKVVIQF